MPEDFTKMLFRVGTQWELESGRYDLRVVTSQADCDKAVAEGWHLDQYAAKDAHEAPEVPADDDPPTREELEQKALELGLKFDGRTSDKKLAAAIEAKLKD